MIFRAKGAAFIFDGSAEWIYIGSILLLMPILQGFEAGLVRGPGHQGFTSGLGLIMMIWLIDTLAAIVFLREGVICLVMAMPLLWGIMGIGYAIGRCFTQLKQSKTLSVSLAPLILLAVVAETSGSLPNYPDTITDSVTVMAPPDYVWRHVVDYPDNPSPSNYWLWRIGLAMPTHSVAPVQKVGEPRACKFSGDQAFDEPITELEPSKKLTFDVTRQPKNPESIGHMTVDRGQITLKPNADGSTTLTVTSWYRLRVRPAGYFDLWASDVTRHIHYRVLGYMKTLAERDYKAVRQTPVPDAN